MTTYYVTADHQILTAIHNPPANWIKAEFAVPEMPFDPMTYLSDNRVENLLKADEETRAQAEQFLAELIKSGHKPESLRDTPEYKSFHA